MKVGMEWLVDAVGCDPESLRDLERMRSVCDRVLAELGRLYDDLAPNEEDEEPSTPAETPEEPEAAAAPPRETTPPKPGGPPRSWLHALLRDVGDDARSLSENYPKQTVVPEGGE